ncbi:hypothetical protein EST38_g9656 [Candolleomyces aberdarensis]|uniref:Fe2OG dioxygenase domain-containing protein n=1 Tax=Candolleomyces aberdarensis TaxID=2316362 RepID=A0A4Q2DBQ4_9AGAR|nr:hypothetical protein EST38_g9656 [Candolleomyces aberdarensis]
MSSTAASKTRRPPLDPALQELQAKVQSLVAPNFCTGTLPLDSSEGGLFYRKDGDGSNASFISFTDGVPQDEEILKLVEVCQQATFGRGEQDVFNESYRKAWKLETAQFSAQFDLARSGIMETVHDQLLHYEKNTMELEPQLYKLNVYGPGSFFKPHVDTPRSENLFASLVVVLPTAHTGGNLLLGKDGSLFDFDSSKLVFDPRTKAPQVAFSAFYSDIEHEVLPVEAGYRITLTYNLYLADTTMSIPKALSSDTLTSLKNAILGLVSDPKILPNGGALGFGLLYQYPINPKYQQDLAKFTGALKGNDALIRTACSSIGLAVAVKVKYRLERNKNPDWISERAHHGGYVDTYTLEDLGSCYFRKRGATPAVGPSGPTTTTDDDYSSTKEKALPLLWVTPHNKMVRTDAAFMTYGNEHHFGIAYGRLVLIAEVPPAPEREALLRREAEGTTQGEPGEGGDADKVDA